jgi:hypothetical protein
LVTGAAALSFSFNPLVELKSANTKSWACSDGLPRQTKPQSKTNGAILRGLNSNTFMACPRTNVWRMFRSLFGELQPEQFVVVVRD